MVSLEGEDTEFKVCENGECPSKTPVPAGTYTVEVQYFYRNEDGTIDPIWEDGKWTTAPLIKTYHVGDKNYCDNAKCEFFQLMTDNDQSYTIDNIKTDEAGVWKFVFDKAAMINFEIVGTSAPAAQNFKCEQKETTTECSSGEDNPPIPSGTYTIQIRTDNNWKDGIPNLTTYFVDNKDYCEGSQDSGEDHESMGSHDSMESHGDANCDFSNIDSVDDQFYKFAGIKIDEEGILKFVFVDPLASVMVRLEGEETEFDVCENGECLSKTPVPADTYTVEVQYFYRNEDGTIDPIWENGKWTTAPLIKTYHVGDK